MNTKKIINIHNFLRKIHKNKNIFTNQNTENTVNI